MKKPNVSPEATRVLASVSIILATIMQTLDSTIANVALPHMQGSMNAAIDQVSWVLTSYVVATAISTPLTGFLERRLGRARLFLGAVLFFTTASALCGLAISLEQIVLFRIIQGATGACIIPLCQTVLMDLFPAEKRGPAMALWGVGVMLGPIIGPSLGGYLTDVANWRWVFFINVPIGIMSAIGIILFLPDTPKDRTGRFDIFGFTVLSVALGCLQLMLDRGHTLDWFSSPEIVLELCLALACFWMFGVHMFSHPAPFMSPKPFRDMNFVAGLVVVFLLGVVLLATMALLPTFLQTLLGYPVQTAGLIMAPRGFGTMIGMFIVGRLIGKLDARYLVTFGVVSMAYSLWQMSQFTLDTGTTPIILSGFIQGVGMGFVFVPLSTVTFYTLAPHLRTEGAAVFSLMRNIGSSIGISVVTTYLSQNTQLNHAVLSESITPFSHALELQASGAGGMLSLGPAAMPLLNAEVTRQAAMLAYVGDFQFMLLLILIALPMVVFLRPSKQTARQ